MPIHPVMAGKFPLLEGVSSIQELFENPALADRRQAFEDHGDRRRERGRDPGRRGGGQAA
jgi:hypothetical protein